MRAVVPDAVMMQHNPYAAPSSSMAPAMVGDDRIVTPEIMEAMSKTRPWVIFLGVLGFIGCALMIVGALWSVVMFRGFDGFQLVSSTMYLAFAALYAFPCTMLLRYGGAIKSLQLGNGVPALTEALQRQSSFWRYVGVVGIIVLGLYGVAAAGMIAWTGF